VRFPQSVLIKLADNLYYIGAYTLYCGAVYRLMLISIPFLASCLDPCKIKYQLQSMG